MKNKIIFLFIITMCLLIAGCNRGELYFNTESEVDIFKDNVYELHYDTNIKDIEWVVEDPDIISIENGKIQGLSEGIGIIRVCYKDVEYAEIVVYVKKKPFQVVYRTLKIDGVPYEVRDKSLLSVNLQEIYDGETHQEFDDASFVGWYMDTNYSVPCDLNMQITSDIEIYSKYRSLEIVSNLRLIVDNIVGYNGRYNDDDNIVTISPAFGTYVDHDMRAYALIVVRYDLSTLEYRVTEVIKDGAKTDLVIPSNGFVIAIKKTVDDYNLYMDNFRVGAKITLSKYSINSANIIYVNEEAVDFTNDFDGNGLALLADYVSVYDVRNKQTLYSAKGDNVTYPASVTKIMTAIVALENAKLEDSITISQELLNIVYEGSSPSVAGLQAGQKWSMRQLLYATLLPSGNDAAYGLASLTINSMYPNNEFSEKEKISKFADLMNATAKKVGATKTHFMTPDGNSYYKDKAETIWDERISNHYVTANDMCKIGNYAFTFGALAETCGTASNSFKLLFIIDLHHNS